MQSFAKIFDYPKLLALALGIISATGFAPLNLWPLTLIGLAGLLHLIIIAPNGRAGFVRGWLFGVGHFSLGLNWIATAFTFQAAMPQWLGWVAVILLSLYLAVYPALATWGLWLVNQRADQRRILSIVFAFAALWIITEWLRSWVFSGFAWNPLGAVMLPMAMAGPSRLIGTYGLSGLFLLLSGAVYLLALRQWRSGGAVALATAVICLLLNPSLAGSLPATNHAITVIQPNIAQQNKWQPDAEAVNFNKLAKLTIAPATAPRLIFWPEAAVPDFLESGYPPNYYYPMTPELSRAKLARLMNPDDVLVLGGLKLELDPKGNAIGARNSVFAMTANAKLGESYNKSHLVPYGEYLPAREWLEPLGLSRLAPGDLDFWPGSGPRNINLGRFGTAGIQVCYEMIFSGQVVDRAHRPDFIFNPSNDAWFGGWGPPQHLAQAQLRAIEEAMPVIRSTPTGISAVIDAQGNLLKSVPLGKAGRINSMLPAPAAPTLFALYGNILPLLFAAILLLSALATARSRR